MIRFTSGFIVPTSNCNSFSNKSKISLKSVGYQNLCKISGLLLRHPVAFTYPTGRVGYVHDETRDLNLDHCV